MASLLIDYQNTTQHQTSIALATGVGNVPASGVLVGQIVDLVNADANCQMIVTGGPTSGPVFVKVQGADYSSGNQVLSGNFTDPTSGFSVFPSQFLSGGRLCVNSGLWGSGFGSVVNNAPQFCSGGQQAGSFQRVNRFVRAIAESGLSFDQPIMVNFTSQLIRTDSGNGYTNLPLSGGIGTAV